MNYSNHHLYRARYVIPISAPPIEDGGVLLRGDVITTVGKFSDLKREYSTATYHDLGEVILLPSLINAHCHLDYTMMRGRLPAGGSFAKWIEGIIKLKSSYSEEDYLNAIVQGAEELSSWGCGTVFNIEAFPHVLPKLPQLPLLTWQFIELMDVAGEDHGKQGVKALERLCSFSENVGISPHAPYTVSQDLYRVSQKIAQQTPLPFCTHLAESEDEDEMFRQGSGVLFDFLKRLGRKMSDCGARGPVEMLLEEDLLPQGALLVHMNILSKRDRELLSNRAGDFSIIHCPKTHRFFERAPFDWKFFIGHGYRLLLGTDSLASNDELNLFSEMQLMAQTAPELSSEEILKMITLHPAAAIGMKGKLGELSPGAVVDMIALPCGNKVTSKKDIFETVIHHQEKPMILTVNASLL